MISRLGRTCALVGLVGAVLLAAAPGAMGGLLPVAVTGFDSNVVTVASPNPIPVVRFDGGTAAWFQAGLGGHNDGLPVSGTIVNDGSHGTTNTGTTFQLQPYSGPNALRILSATGTGTLTLVTPGSYASVAILASSGSGGGPAGKAILNFVGGATASITYHAEDWNQNGTPKGPAAIGALGRNENVGAAGTSFTYGNPVPFAMYETDFDLFALGLNTAILQSITFNGVAGTGSGAAAVTGIFAISGAPVPEPSTLILCGLGGLGLLGFAWRRPKIAV
jgi:hypothetical protein